MWESNWYVKGLVFQRLMDTSAMEMSLLGQFGLAIFRIQAILHGESRGYLAVGSGESWNCQGRFRGTDAVTAFR